MKKMLMFCVLGMVALCVCGTHVMADEPTPSVESECSDYDLQHGQSEEVSCDRAGKDNAYQCFVYCDAGTSVIGIKSCIAGFYLLGQMDTPSDLYEYCGNVQAACESEKSRRSGARWNPYSRKCDCGGLDYEWDSETMQCELSDNFNACNKAGNTTWNYKLGICVCVGEDLQWDHHNHKCVPLPSEARCDSFKDNENFEGDAEWNPVTKRCECKKDNEGKTISKPEEYWIGDFGCEKKLSVLRREEFAANKPAADAKHKEITDTIAQLNDISEGMGKSRWKNADGGFNTARLASDSIAGVVLGTVGGVITSNVIKKNQVKGGFEDINCVIGGQRVAGFADQFRVGIK